MWPRACCFFFLSFNSLSFCHSLSFSYLKFVKYHPPVVSPSNYTGKSQCIVLTDQMLQVDKRDPNADLTLKRIEAIQKTCISSGKLDKRYVC